MRLTFITIFSLINDIVYSKSANFLLDTQGNICFLLSVFIDSVIETKHQHLSCNSFILFKNEILHSIIYQYLFDSFDSGNWLFRR